MNKILLYAFLIALSLNVQAGWYLTNDVTGERTSSGILDGFGTIYDSGILDSGCYYYSSGIYLDSDNYFSYYESGILDRSGEYWSDGILSAVNGYSRQGILEYPDSLGTYSYGTLDSSYVFHEQGIINQGTYYEAGVLSDGQWYASGILDAYNMGHASGILDAYNNYYENGIISVGAYLPYGILMADGNIHDKGILPYSDGTGYQSWGVLSDTSVFFDITNALHTVSGGQVAASTIGNFTGTTNLVADLLKLGETVDDVTGTLSAGSTKPGFGGGAFSQ